MATSLSPSPYAVDAAPPGPARWSDAAGFALVFCVVNLHLLRNVSAPLYLAVYGAVSVWVAVLFVRRGAARGLSGRGLLLAGWIAVAVLGAVTTVAVSSVGAGVYGLVRFLFAVPVFLALATFTHSAIDLRRHLTTMVGFFVVASWTLPLQFVTGAIPWFSDVSVRGVEVRYGSLVGSLTSIGIVVGCFLVLCVALPRRWVWWGAVLVTAPALVSLSKAAIANVVIGWVVLLVVQGRRGRVSVPALLGVPLVAVPLLALLPPVRLRIETIVSSFGVQTAAGQDNYDVSVVQSVVDRLTSLPAANWNALENFSSPLAYLTGGGFGMGNTALVTEADSAAPMAHNQYVEFLSVFGVVLGLALVLVTVWILARTISVARVARTPVATAVAATAALLVVNALLANGTVYQPASASVFYLTMFVALKPQIMLAPTGVADQVSNERKRSSTVNPTDYRAAARRFLVPAVVCGAVVAGLVVLLGAATSGTGTPRPYGSYVRVAFVPAAGTAADANDTAAFITNQMGYYSQLAQTDAAFEAANGSPASDDRIAEIKKACSLSIPANNVMELLCTGVDPEANTALLGRWSEAIAAVVEERGVPADLRSTVEVTNITEPQPGAVAEGSVRIGTLIYPAALLLGVLAGAAVVVLLERRRARADAVSR